EGFCGRSEVVSSRNWFEVGEDHLGGDTYVQWTQGSRSALMASARRGPVRTVMMGLIALPAIAALTFGALSAWGTGGRLPPTDEGGLPDLGGAIGWLNSPPLTGKSLPGPVVLVDFWTYTCINSLRPLPYVKAWAEKYKEAGLVVIGVHTPEFSFEKERANVERAVRDLKVGYPVAIDSDHRIWEAFGNAYW